MTKQAQNKLAAAHPHCYHTNVFYWDNKLAEKHDGALSPDW